ncbi:MAG: hypothetical protein EB084_11300 [Proteobacteria bacterium]|nr:hypothetical protein [Pseudomonadota bacterium]
MVTGHQHIEQQVRMGVTRPGQQRAHIVRSHLEGRARRQPHLSTDPRSVMAGALARDEQQIGAGLLPLPRLDSGEPFENPLAQGRRRGLRDPPPQRQLIDGQRHGNPATRGQDTALPPTRHRPPDAESRGTRAERGHERSRQATTSLCALELALLRGCGIGLLTRRLLFALLHEVTPSRGRLPQVRYPSGRPSNTEGFWVKHRVREGTLLREETPPLGLTEDEARLRFDTEGPNEIARPSTGSMLQTGLRIVSEPMIGLLMAGAGLYLALGDRAEALMLLGSVLLIVGIGTWQERRSERALEGLRDMACPRARVVREGSTRRIPGREVVRGDLVMLAEGDRVPADGAVLRSTHLSIDESLLSGESVPVSKHAWNRRAPLARPGGANAFVYAGTLVSSGQALVQVLETGSRTEAGRIGAAVGRAPLQVSRLQRESRRAVRFMALSGLAVCAGVFALHVSLRGSWLHALLAAITLAMSLLPEEIPLVLTLFTAMGAWRLARKNVLTRRIPAVESLGTITVLCVDKTGTLTQNRLTVSTLHNLDCASAVRDGCALEEPWHEVLEYAVLASHRDAVDPIDSALRACSVEMLGGTEHLHDDWHVERDYPVSGARMAVCRVWRTRRERQKPWPASAG